MRGLMLFLFCLSLIMFFTLFSFFSVSRVSKISRGSFHYIVEKKKISTIYILFPLIKDYAAIWWRLCQMSWFTTPQYFHHVEYIHKASQDERKMKWMMTTTTLPKGAVNEFFFLICLKCLDDQGERDERWMWSSTATFCLLN